MASIDDELSQIERDIRQLKIEYEQYFGGGRSRPPTDTQWRCETLVKRYAERSAELSTGQRFRYNNLSSTYAKYQDMWRKKMQQKEGGVTQHHYGAAAKAIEAERARKAAVERAAGPSATARGVSTETAVAEAVAAGSHAAAEAASLAAQAKRQEQVFALAVSDPDAEQEKVQQLYKKLIEARAEAGEKAGAPSLKDFERFVQQKTKDLKTRKGQAVEYTVSIEAGRVKLKARVSP
jgi:hypothetical protein